MGSSCNKSKESTVSQKFENIEVHEHLERIKINKIDELQLIKNNNLYQVIIDLSNQNISDQDIFQISQSLNKVQIYNFEIDLSNIHLKNKSLVVLINSINNFRQNLANLSLNLSKNEFDSQVINEMVQRLSYFHDEKYNKLQKAYLNFSNNNLDDISALSEFLAQQLDLGTLNLQFSYCNINNLNFKQFITQYIPTKNFQSMSFTSQRQNTLLNSNFLNDSSTYTNLKLRQLSLDFSYNHIQDDALEPFQDKLYQFENLQHFELNLQGNNIKEHGCNYIINAVLKLKYLLSFKLDLQKLNYFNKKFNYK